MADIFLSYSSQDRERITPLIQSLKQQGWSVWWDRRIPPGKTWHQVIQQALDDARCVVVVWSKNSTESDWVITEAEEGMSRKILVPVLIEEARIPLAIRRIQAARLIGWQGESSHHELVMLFESITAIIGEAAPDEEPALEERQVSIQTTTAQKKSPFLMGKYQVTQAQWRVVAGFPKVRLDLDPIPSGFKDGNLPVVRVSWKWAMEFCARLSQKTGRTY